MSDVQIFTGNDDFTGLVPMTDEEERYLSRNAAVMNWSVADVEEVHTDYVALGLRIENQKSMGSCQGAALTTGMETAYYDKTGKWIHLSKLYAYIESQRYSGSRLLGRDAGSTMYSGVRLATEKGVPLETTVPYPNPVRYPRLADYERMITDAVQVEALDYMIQSWVEVKSWDDALAWIWSKVGKLHMGTAWPLPFDAGFEVNTMRGAGRGGHAHCVTNTRRKNGRLQLVDRNSHSERAQDGGTFYWSERGFNAALEHPDTRVYGITDMNVAELDAFDPSKDLLMG